MQLHGLIRVVDLRLRLYARVGVAIATQKLLDVVFHLGHFGAVIELARLNFRQALDFGGVTSQITADFNAGKLVLIAFSDVNGNVDAFFIRRQADLGRVNVETRVATIEVVAA